MGIGFEPKSDNIAIEELNNKINEILDSQLVAESGNDNTLTNISLGRRNSAAGEAGGIRSNQPLIHEITDIDSAGVVTGVFDKINIISSMAIIDYSATPITLRYIQGDVKNGTRIKITPKLGKTINVSSGGNILTIATIPVTDTQFYELVKYSEAETGVVGGAWKLFLASTGGAGNVPPGTVENQHIEWDNSSLLWLPVDSITMGATGPFADSGLIKFSNDQIMLSARNAADDGNMEFKVNSADFFDLTDSSNQPVVLQVRAQHAVNPDQIMQLIQLSGTGAVSELRAPNVWNIYASGVDVMNLDQNKIDVNKNILPIAGDGVLRIGNTTAPNRFLGVHASEFGIDTNSRLNFTTGGTTTINQGTSLTVLIAGGQRVLITSSITQLTGNVDVLANLGIGGYADIAEIGVPGNPAANTARLYAKDVSTLTRLFYRDTLGTEIPIGMSFVGFEADGDLDMNTFDIFDVDNITFQLGGAALLDTDVGFSGLAGGGLQANILDTGIFTVTKENVPFVTFDANNEQIIFEGIDDAVMFFTRTTGVDQTASIGKFNNVFQISDPTKVSLAVNLVNIVDITNTGLAMTGSNFITTPQIGFSILGNIIEDDAGGMIFKTPPTKEFTWSDGTTEFAILNVSGLLLNALFIQNTSISPPAATGFANVGKVFFDSTNSHHYSVRRNGGVIDLEGGPTVISDNTDVNTSGALENDVMILDDLGVWRDRPQRGLDTDSFKVYDQTIEDPFNEETWYGLEINAAFNADVYDRVMVVGDMWLAPLILTKPTTISGLGLYAETSVGGSQYVLGIYTDIGLGRLRPNAKVVQAITPTSSVRFEPVNTSSTDLNPGNYWMAIKCTANPASVGTVRAIPYSMLRPILGYGDNDDGDEATFIGPGVGYLIQGLGTSTTLPTTITANDLGKLESGGGSTEAQDVFPNIFLRYTAY